MIRLIRANKPANTFNSDTFNSDESSDDKTTNYFIYPNKRRFYEIPVSYRICRIESYRKNNH